MAMARRGLFYTFLALYLREVLGLSVTATTLLASLTMVVNSFSQTFIWGRLSDKYQARTSLVVIGETIAAFGYIIVYFVHAYLLGTNGKIEAAYSIIAGLSILEFFWSMSNLGWSALISDLTNPQERGRTMSLISSIGGVGRIVGISVSGMLYDWGGEGGGFTNGMLFFFASGIMLASAVVVWFSVRNSERMTQSSQDVGTIPSQSEELSRRVNSRNFYWFLIVMFIVGLGTYSILQILIFYVAQSSPIGASSFDITMIRNSASIATIIASLVVGPLANKIGRKNTLGLGIALTAITPILYTLANNVVEMMLINSLNGVSMAILNVVGYLFASDLIPPERRGRLFGKYNAVTYISFGVAGTFIGGPIADYLINTGLSKAASYVATFRVASVICVGGLVLYALRVKSTVSTGANDLEK
jgi:MFS family permease